MIFNNVANTDNLQSFSAPFVSMSDVEIEQPVFGANFLKGKVAAQENGNFTGQIKFKLLFKKGGAIDFGQAMLRAAAMAQRNAHNQAPPPYTPPTGSWYQAPPPAYTPNPQGYYGWLPNTQNFPNGPPPDGVFMTDNPPPYPGINPSVQPGQQPPNNYPSSPPGYSNGYNGGSYSPGYGAQNGGGPPAAGYQGGYGQPGFSGPSLTGFPAGPQSGFGNPQPPRYQLPPSYPGHQLNSGYQDQPNQGYPNPGYPQPGAMGFSGPPASKFLSILDHKTSCFLI